MALPKTDRILGIDPGWRNIGIVWIAWNNRVRRVEHRHTITTSNKMPDGVAWSAIIGTLHGIFASEGCPDVIACEDMRGVRYGHDERKSSSSSTDEIRDVQAVIRTLAYLYGKRLFFVRSLSGYAAMGAKISKLRGETQHMRKARQKAANAAAAMRVFSGAENLTEHEWDACVHAGAVMLGKGEEQ